VISSPEGAKLRVDQELYDAADPDSALAITVHQTSSGSLCNFWINQSGLWWRVLSERGTLYEKIRTDFQTTKVDATSAAGRSQRHLCSPCPSVALREGGAFGLANIFYFLRARFLLGYRRALCLWKIYNLL